MLTLTAWEPDARHGADEALKTVTELHSGALLQLYDAAAVSREAGQQPKIRELLDNTPGRGGQRRVPGTAVRSVPPHDRRGRRRAARLRARRRHHRRLHRRGP